MAGAICLSHLGGINVSGIVRVRMLGDFVIYGENAMITDTQNRSKKVWALLAFLLCNHGRVVSQNELIDLLWRNDGGNANPASALKTTLHRARALLDQLEPAGGHVMLLNRGGGYTWNDEVALEIDAEEFEQLCRNVPADELDGGLERLRRALSLYEGTFLNNLSSENWVIPRSTYYHNLYIQSVGKVLELMETGGLWAEAEDICRAALRIEPYQEDFYQHLMRILLAMGQQAKAAGVFEEMSKLLLANFGVMPDQESRSLYREALRTVNRKTVSMEMLREQLREEDDLSGAMVCDYDFFKMIYRAEARMLVRSGNAAHLALVSVGGVRGKELPQRSLDIALDNLEELLRLSLRKGDVICRCSPTQFLVMLPQSNFENSGMVCRRIEKAFTRRYPHSPAELAFNVYPLEPAEDITKPKAAEQE